MSLILMIWGSKRRTSLFSFMKAFLFSLFTYSNKPLMPTRITGLCRVLNSFVLLIHSWVLLMLLRQGRCPRKNVNAATGSTLSYIFSIPVSQHQSKADAFLLNSTLLLMRLLFLHFGGYLTSSWSCHNQHLLLTPHRIHG